MKKLVTTFWLLFLAFCCDAAAQVPPAQPVEPEVMSASTEVVTTLRLPEDNQVQGIAPNGVILLSSTEGGRRSFSLRNPEQDGAIELPFEMESRSSGRDRFYLRVDGRHVLFSDYSEPQLEIYDYQSGSLRRVRHPEGLMIVSGSVSLSGDVLYQVREGLTGQPEVYLQKKESSQPTFIAEAMGEQWSPDGRYFILTKLRNPNVAKSFGEQKWWDWWIYDREGRPVVSLRSLGQSNEVQWSPDSEKLVYEPTFERPGFYIVYLDDMKEALSIAQMRYVEPPENVAFRNTAWSTDGSKLAYTAEYGGDEIGERKELRVLVQESLRQYIAGSARNLGPDSWHWASPMALYVYAPGEPLGRRTNVGDVMGLAKVRLKF